ncbi:peptidylprolyl isomerase [Chryseobacterium aquaticum]|uniref:Peptidylprolyl isomerase n=1 Tax=Chryseobacterium aquaticum TaxID=452084 RepID=A0A848N631_9FLAO|nr:MULTISPECIES: peptidylprolyl isomerase [Chryseobacterium]NMR32783.1 peptidylprolyl isomerase [Chryseobacterium aquaticum]NRQ45287.1 peptidylprolyl isomerase [Chryseobacterium sp. C-204]
MNKLFLILSLLAVQLFFSQEVIDLKVENNKKTDTPLDLSKKQVELYNGRFSQFIIALKSSDRKKMESLLSENAKKQVTEAVYKKLSSDINSNKKMEIIRTGYKPLINGNNYPMIQYKYADDKSDDPKEVITAVFENDGKILGIKPFKKTK